MTDRSWKVIDAERGLFWHEYRFRKGASATTFAFRGADGLVVVSPGSKADPAVYDELEKHGEVRALVANNSFHHLGQAAWRARFPKAVSYAASSVLPALEKKVPGSKFRPIEELALPSHAKAHPLSGCKSGELFFTVGSGKGPVWYTGDILTNIQNPQPPFSWLFKLTDSAPGYRLFRMAVFLFVKDKPALREHLLSLLAAEPPAIVVPGHGPIVEKAGLPADTKAQIERL